MYQTRLFFIAIYLLFVMPGCTWVKLSPNGSLVSIVSSSDVVGCHKIGTTTVSLLSKVAGVNRNADKVAQELATLGRNAAAEMGGDTTLAVSEINNGEQTFEVYQCAE